MLDSATKELIEKGFTDANDANALGSRATDGEKHLSLSFGTKNCKIYQFSQTCTFLVFFVGLHL